MKKLMFTFVLVSFIGGFCYSFLNKKVVEDDIFFENVESLSNTEMGMYYRVVTGPCPDPVNYKRWVICANGGYEMACIPSDC